MNVYKKKPNGRYENIGQEWTGFPSDGIWFVKDGTQNCIMQLSSTCELPHNYLATAQYQEECIKYIFDKKVDSMFSMREISELAAEFYAKKLSKELDERN